MQLAFAARRSIRRRRCAERILEAARAERDSSPRCSSRRPRSRGAGQRRPAGLAPPAAAARTAIAAAAAIAACLVIGLGIWNVSLSNQLNDARSALTTVPIDGANGSVVVGAGNKGVLVVSNLDDAPAGKTYEAWVIDGGAARPAGTFGGGGTVAVKLEHPVRSGSVVAVTVEREGGSQQPTSKPFITSQPV